MQLGDRAGADKFVANEPMNKAGVHQRVKMTQPERRRDLIL
jgi:hypothetical protein